MTCLLFNRSIDNLYSLSAHALSQSTSLGYSNWILKQRIPTKGVQPETFEAIVKKTSVVYLMKDDDIDRQVNNFLMNNITFLSYKPHF
jgi:hypothetical protein